MASISIFVGQCGSQLGTSFLHTIADEAEKSKSEDYQLQVSRQFFRTHEERGGGDSSASRPVARAVLIDMEPKVVDDCIALAGKRGLFRYAPNYQCVTKCEGSANNWAFGFHHQGPSRQTEIVDSVRSEIEMSFEDVNVLHLVHSVAGGTGAGVGSYISQILRDEYPHLALHHTVVWPFEQGELSTQWFNALHTLHHLEEYADSIHLLSNDEMIRFQSVAASSGAAGVSSTGVGVGGSSRGKSTIHDINRVMGVHMAALHLPSVVAQIPPPQVVAKRSKMLSEGKGPSSSVFEPCSYHDATWADVIEAVSIDPRRKFFESLTAPTESFAAQSPRSRTGSVTGALAGTWSGLLQDPLRTASRMSAFSGLLVLRGNQSLQVGSAELQGVLRQSPFRPHGLHVSNVPFLGYDTHASLFTTNSTSIVQKLEHCIERVGVMVDAGAFLHHFSRFGAEPDSFQDALLAVQNMAENYRSEHRALGMYRPQERSGGLDDQASTASGSESPGHRHGRGGARDAVSGSSPEWY
jgi:hypothetical protein